MVGVEILDFLKDLLGATSPIYLTGAGLLALWSYLFLRIKGAAVNSRDRAILRCLVRLSAAPYTKLTGLVLRALPRLLLPETHADDPPPKSGWFRKLDWWAVPRAKDKADLQRLIRNPWSWPMLDMAIKIAVAYPTILALTHWTFAESAVGGGLAPLFDQSAPQTWRIALFGLVAVLLVSRLLLLTSKRSVYQRVFQWLFYSTPAFALVSALVGATGFSIGFALTGALFGAFALSGAFVLAFSLAGPIAGAIAFVFGVPAAFSGILVGIPVLATTFACVAALSAASANGRGPAGYTLFLFTAAAAASFAIFWDAVPNAIAGLLLGLAILPLLNAVMDWLSYGTTVWLLRAGHRKGRGWAFVAGVADVLAALMFFAVLSMLLVVVFAAIDAARPEPLIGVGQVLEELEEGPNENLWVILMVASTLIPTLTHAALAILSLTLLFPRGIWAAALKQLRPNNARLLIDFAAATMATLSLAYIVVPLGGIWLMFWSLWTYGGALREAYVKFLILFAHAIGAL